MKIKNIIAFTLTICIILSIITPAFNATVRAASNADLTKNEIIKSASDYIKSSKNSDNSIGYSGLINDTAEAVAVLERFTEEDVSASIDWVNGFKKTNNDENARAIMANKSTDTLSDIFKSQNTDGGFGLTAEYESDVFDSILVLEAINSLGQKDRSNATWRLVTYIARQMNKNGSYSYTKNSDENVALTAMALYTVSKFMHDNSIKSDLTTDMINKSSAYLISKSKNTFDKETIEESIYVDLALQEAGLFELQEETINALKKVQGNDGSFYGNVHLTSLVIWLLGKMGSVTNVTVYDLKSTNTSQAYYGVDTDINVSYSISYAAKADKDFTVGCSIVNGSETIYESEKEAVKLVKNQSVYSGSFKDIKINQDKDNGIKVIVTLYDGDEVVKKSEGKITMENQPRVGETEITDFTLELSDYYVVAGSSIDVTATYKLLYTTNVENAVDMQVTLSKEGNVLKEETFNEALLPETDSIEREAMTFTPDTSGECKYTVTVKCLHQGDLVAENSADFNVVVIPKKTDDVHTITDASETPIPFTVSWIGPKLSSYMVYAGKKQTITGDVGIVYYGDTDFTGKVITKVTFGEDIIAESEKDVSLSKDLNDSTVEKSIEFEVSKLGEYVVTSTLCDMDGTELSSGSKSVKVVNKKKIDLIMNIAKVDYDNHQVDITWNDITTDQEKYNYHFYRRKNDGDWETRSIWNGEKVNVLNIHPGYPSLYNWMNSPIGETGETASRGVIDVDSVYFRDFNNNPESYLFDEKGNYKYDVLMVGSSDMNGGWDFSYNAYECVRAFLNSGRGALFGHDSVVDNPAQVHRYLADLGKEYLGFSYYDSNGGGSGSWVDVVNHGVLTSYPWKLTGTLNIPYSHTSGQYVPEDSKATIWMAYTGYNNKDNFYLISNGSCAMSQTGHSGSATDDERKILANTLFYLKRLGDTTKTSDNDYYDVDAPEVPEITGVSTEGANYRISLSSKDIGTRYQYYVSGVPYSGDEKSVENSNIETLTALSGIKGYVYELSETETSNPDIIKYDENHEHIINVNEATDDEIFNIDMDLNDISNKKYLHVYAIDNADNISGEKIINLEKGILSPSISTDKNEYNPNETVKINSSTSVLPFNVVGDVSISLFDENDNFIEELFGKNGQLVSVDAPFSTEHEIALDESYSGSYKVKIEWTTADAETYSDITEFSIVIPSNKEDDEKKTDDVHTATDADNSKTDNSNNNKDDTDRTDKDDNNKQNDTTRDNESNSTNVVTNTTEEKQNPSSVSSTQNNPASDKTDKKNSKDKTKKNQPTKKQTESTTEVTTETTTQSPTQPTTQATTDRVPEKPANPSTPSTVKNRTPETGDEVNLILLFATMGISAIIAVRCLIYKKSSKE